MKWAALLALLALAAVATRAESGVFVGGIEYVDSAEDIPRSQVDEVFSYIEAELGADDSGVMLELDADSELDEHTPEQYTQALAFIATHQTFRTQFLGNALKNLKAAAQKGLQSAKGKLKEQALKEIVKLGKKGFAKLSPTMQALIREIAGIVQGAAPTPAPKPKAKGKGKGKPKDDGKGMDPYAAKHYKKGFIPGSLGTPNLMAYKPPASAVQAKLVEDCMACRFVWKHVEMDVGNSNAQKTVYDSFIHHCRRGMSAPLLYQPCQAMFTTIDDMMHGYVAGLSVDEVCAQARMCR